jgi:hypothetical protein
MLEEVPADRRAELIAALIKIAQETNPALYERSTDRQLRRWGGVVAFGTGLVATVGVLLLGYQVNPPLPVVIGLVTLAAAALGIGGAIVTGQKVTVKEVTQGAADMVRAMKGDDSPERKESER